MPADLEDRLRSHLAVGEPPSGSAERMRTRIEREAVASNRTRTRRTRRSTLVGVIATGAVIGGFAVFFVVAAPRGTTPEEVPGQVNATYSVLNGGAAFDLAESGLLEAELFPGIQPDGLRVARTLSSGGRIVVGRASNDFICLITVPSPRDLRRSRQPVRVSSSAVGIPARAVPSVGTSCGSSDDVGRSALLALSPDRAGRSVVLVADGWRVSYRGRPIAVRNNVALLPPRPKLRHKRNPWCRAAAQPLSARPAPCPI